jgi:hypothetical protein
LTASGRACLSPLVTALHAAKTLATYHRERAENSADDARAFHQDMDRRGSADAEDIKRMIAGAGVTVEDRELAAMVQDIASSLFAARGEQLSA